MENEVERFYALLCRFVVRHPKSRTDHRKLPILVAAPDFAGSSSTKFALSDVTVNDGLHIHGSMVVPIRSRLKVGLDRHIEQDYQHYVKFGGLLRRIDVRPLLQ